MINNRAINVTCLLEKDIDEIVVMDDDGAGNADKENGLPYMDKIDRSLWSVCIDGTCLHCKLAVFLHAFLLLAEGTTEHPALRIA